MPVAAHAGLYIELGGTDGRRPGWGSRTTVGGRFRGDALRPPASEPPVSPP